MRKSIIFLGMLGFTMAYAQQDAKGKVGINTNTPKATLDIKPTKENKTSTSNEGLLVPRLSKSRVASMQTPEVSTLVYVNNTSYTAGSNTGANSRVANIDAVGYYHYNGTQWVKHLSTDEGSKWTNDSRNGAVKLTKLSDGKTAREDSKNVFINNSGYLGIRTKPISAITIEGDGGESDNIRIHSYSNKEPADGGVLAFSKYRGTPGNKEAVKAGDWLGDISFIGYNGKSESIYDRITSIVSEVSGNTIKSNLILTPNDGNVGIGAHTFVPTHKLDVQGNIRALGTLKVEASGALGGYIHLANTSKIGRRGNRWVMYNATSPGYHDGLMFWNYDDSKFLSFPVLMISDQGNMGIGTGIYKGNNELQEKLEVNGAIRISNTGNACTDANRGTIKYANGEFYGCKPTGWVKQIDTNTLYTAGEGIQINGNTISRNGGLEKVTQGINSGWKLIGVNAKGKIGANAVDLSISGGATGDLSIAMGSSTTASGFVATAMGGDTTASGRYSTAMGYQTLATGDGSVAMGFKSKATASGSIAIGEGALARGDNSIAIGYGALTTSSNSVAVGYYNYEGNDNNNVFMVGAGKFNNGVTTKSNAIVVRKDGKVGIGLDQGIPTETLEVGGKIKMKAEALGNCGTNNRGTIAFYNDNFYGCKSTGWVQLNNR